MDEPDTGVRSRQSGDLAARPGPEERIVAMCQPEVISRLYADVAQDRLGLAVAPGLDGNVVVEAHGLKVVLENFAPQDPEYFRAFLVGDFAASPEVLAPLLAKVEKRKGIKCDLREESTVVVSYEAFLAGQDCVPSADLLAETLPRVLHALLGAVGVLVTGVELAGIAKASGESTEAV